MLAPHMLSSCRFVDSGVLVCESFQFMLLIIYNAPELNILLALQKSFRHACASYTTSSICNIDIATLVLRQQNDPQKSIKRKLNNCLEEETMLQESEATVENFQEASFDQLFSLLHHSFSHPVVCLVYCSVAAK